MDQTASYLARKENPDQMQFPIIHLIGPLDLTSIYNIITHLTG